MSRRSAMARCAFSIIELMVVISIICIVIGLALPAMRHARNQTLLTKSLANQRQLVTLLGTYAGDYRDQFPYLATPGQPYGPAMIRGFDMRSLRPNYEGGYFGAHQRFWLNVFDDRDLPPDREIGIDFVSDIVPTHVRYSKVFLTSTTAASPEHFASDQERPLPDGPQFRGMAWTDILFPTSKGVLVDFTRRTLDALKLNPSDPRLAARFSTTRGDGSAFVTPILTPDVDDRWVDAGSGNAGFVLTTRDGFRGRDFAD